MKKFKLWILYHYYWNKIDKLQKKYNICNMYINSKNGKWCCRRDRYQEVNGCCGGCNHKNEIKGCETKSLYCKLWLCDIVKEDKKLQEEAKVYFDYLDYVQHRMIELGMPFCFRANFKESFCKEQGEN